MRICISDTCFWFFFKIENKWKGIVSQINWPLYDQIYESSTKIHTTNF